MENLMNIKTLSAVALVAVAVSSPVFAQDAATQKPVHVLRHYSGAYNQVQGPAVVAPRGSEGLNAERDFDRSRIGDRDPDFNPSGS
jgi:hypothetical protein